MSVEQDLQQIMSARYGKDVRQSIHDAIYDINEVAKRAEYDASTAPESARAYAEAALASLQAAEDAQQAAEDAAEQAMSGTPAGYIDVVADVYSLKENTGTYLANSKSNIGRVLLDKMYGMSLQNGTPTPSVPVEIKSAKANFKCVGKNLYDINGRNAYRVNAGVTCTIDEINQTITFNGTATSNAANPGANFNNTDKFIKANVGEKITLSFEVISGTATTINNFSVYLNMPNANLSAVVTTKNLSKGIKGSTTLTVTSNMLTADGYLMAGSIQRWMNTGDVYNNLVMVWQIERGDTATDFEPYEGQAVSTDLTLRAIEVTSTDNYNLVKDGKYYVADTLEKIDGGYQITRRINHLELISTWHSITLDASGKFFVYHLPIDKSVSTKFAFATGWARTKSNRFVEGVIGNTSTETVGKGGIIISNNYCRIGIDSSIATTLDGVCTWLANNPSYIDYILETTTVEAVSDANAIKLLSLKSYDEATYVAQTEDTEGVMVLEYGQTNYATKALSGYVEAESNSIRIGLLENA